MVWLHSLFVMAFLVAVKAQWQGMPLEEIAPGGLPDGEELPFMGEGMGFGKCFVYCYNVTAMTGNLKS